MRPVSGVNEPPNRPLSGERKFGSLGTAVAVRPDSAGREFVPGVRRRGVADHPFPIRQPRVDAKWIGPIERRRLGPRLFGSDRLVVWIPRRRDPPGSMNDVSGR